MKHFLVLSILLAWMTILNAQETENRALPAFERVNIAGGFDKIIFVEGANTSVKVVAEGIPMDKIITEVKNGSLNIHQKNDSGKSKIYLTVTYSKLDEINNSGSTDITVDATLKSDDFTFNNSGSGDFRAEVALDKLSLNLSGSGDALLSGHAENQYFAISGSGDINASALKGQSADVSISGSGDVTLNVKGNVNSSVAGSGEVHNNGD